MLNLSSINIVVILTSGLCLTACGSSSPRAEGQQATGVAQEKASSSKPRVPDAVAAEIVLADPTVKDPELVLRTRRLLEESTRTGQAPWRLSEHLPAPRYVGDLQQIPAAWFDESVPGRAWQTSEAGDAVELVCDDPVQIPGTEPAQWLLRFHVAAGMPVSCYAPDVRFPNQQRAMSIRADAQGIARFLVTPDDATGPVLVTAASLGSPNQVRVTLSPLVHSTAQSSKGP